MRVAVIGLGAAGSAAARFVARAGHEVTGFEQFALGHDRGSSHGESRIIRYTYPDRLYTQMMGDAYPLWRALEEEAGEELLVRCGGLFFGRGDDPAVHETRASLAAAGLPFEELGPEAVADRHPALRLAAGETALYQAESGFLRATRCVFANARLARARGAELHESARVVGFRQRGDEVVVQTAEGGEDAFDRAIVAAGPWIARLFPQLRLPLRVTRQQIVYLAIAAHPERFEPGGLPVWIDASANVYGFPNDGVVHGAKIASHDLGETVDPDVPPPPVDDAYVAQISAYASRRLPDLGPQATHTQACLYTNAPDEDFLLDLVPGSPRIVLLSGCSGHGFKFSVLLGKIAAELASGGSCGRGLSRFSAVRWAARRS